MSGISVMQFGRGNAFHASAAAMLKKTKPYAVALIKSHGRFLKEGSDESSAVRSLKLPRLHDSHRVAAAHLSA